MKLVDGQKLRPEPVNVMADHLVNDFPGRDLVLFGGCCQPIRYFR
jgi:hypothetical protein